VNASEEKTKLHLLVDVVNSCINKPYAYFLQLHEEDIDATQEYDYKGEATDISGRQKFQSRVSLLNFETDANGYGVFQVDIAIFELFETENTLSVDAGFMVHEKDGID
jgi:hypothetical protein